MQRQNCWNGVDHLQMYYSDFGLRENAFSLTPDPKYLFMSPRHVEALAHLNYGIDAGAGFVMITGEPGTGKTTLCRHLLAHLPEDVDAAVILNPALTPIELVAAICDELQIAYQADPVTLKAWTDLLNRHLINSHVAGRRTVLIVDEAQNLSAEVLEQIRLLTNLETDTHKLLQIILLGQPELRQVMAGHRLRQLSQRITARYHLGALSLEDTRRCIGFRLKIAGGRLSVFSAAALRAIYRLSGGVPRRINALCDRAMLGAYALHRRRISRALIYQAYAEVSGHRARMRRRWWAPVAMVACVCGLWLFWDSFGGGQLAVLQTHLSRLSQPNDAPVHRTRPIPIVGKPEPAFPESATSAQPQTLPAETGDFHRQLGDATFYTGTDDAFRALFKLWGLNYDALPGNSGCERAAQAGLACYHGRGNWTSLTRHHRPAVLEVIDNEGQLHDVVVTAITDRSVVVHAGERRLQFSRADVENCWLGEFILLWRPPELQSALLKKGDRGPDVIWLRQSLEWSGREYGGASPPADPSRFDDELELRVKQFQTSRGIQADGVVGATTVMHLRTAQPPADVPQLVPSARTE